MQEDLHVGGLAWVYGTALGATACAWSALTPTKARRRVWRACRTWNSPATKTLTRPEKGDEDMEAEGEEPNEIDQSNCGGDAGATPEKD